MKINRVETLYLRQPEVKYQCDSGQDALIVRVETDAGITGIGEVDSNPMAAKGTIEGPFSHTTTAGLASIVVGEDPFETEKIWHKMYRANIYGGRRGVGRRPDLPPRHVVVASLKAEGDRDELRIGIAAACVALAAVLFLPQRRPVLCGAELASALAFVLLDLRAFRMPPDLLHVLADAALLSPIFLLPIEAMRS